VRSLQKWNTNYQTEEGTVAYILTFDEVEFPRKWSEKSTWVRSTNIFGPSVPAF